MLVIKQGKLNMIMEPPETQDAFTAYYNSLSSEERKEMRWLAAEGPMLPN